MNPCRFIPCGFILLNGIRSCLLHEPETGFAYSSTEASDVLVCWYHVSSEAERGVSPFDRCLSVLGWIPSFRFRQLTNEACGFLAELRHENRTPRVCCVCHATLPVWQYVWWQYLFQFRQILNTCCWSQEVNLQNRFFAIRSEGTMGPLCTCCTTFWQGNSCVTWL